MFASLANLEFVGERIEVGLKKGKFDYVASTNSSSRRLGMNGVKKRKGEAHTMVVVPDVAPCGACRPWSFFIN